jgi:hypothetical protein
LDKNWIFIHMTDFVIVFNGGFHLITIICRFQMLEFDGFFYIELFWLIFINYNTEFDWRGAFGQFNFFNINF